LFPPVAVVVALKIGLILSMVTGRISIESPTERIDEDPNENR
jgi:hypothetical protein